MDLATVVGFVGAFGIVTAAIVTGGSFLIFVNVPSILIVIGGTLFVVAMKFSLPQFLSAVKVAMKAFMFQSTPREELIKKCVELADVARKSGGVLGLQEVKVEDPFMQKGIDLLVDGFDREIVEMTLSQEMNLTVARHDTGKKIFTSMADAAPAMGMIGTLVGLVQMLSSMDDPASIGPSMAVALLTTLYGAMMANMFAGPVADKLSIRSEEEQTNKALIIDAVLGINQGLNPRVIEDMLQNYMPSAERKKADDAA